MFIRQQKITDQGLKQLLKDNHENQIEVIRFTYSCIPAQGIRLFSTGKWASLKELTLGNAESSSIGNLGCKYLTRASLPCIQFLHIYSHQIDAAGAMHLSKATWETLTTMAILKNQLGSGSMEALMRVNWPKIDRFHLLQNSITAQQAKYMLLASAHKLLIDLGQNKIEYEKRLIQTMFKNRNYEVYMFG